MRKSNILSSALVGILMAMLLFKTCAAVPVPGEPDRIRSMPTECSPNWQQMSKARINYSAKAYRDFVSGFISYEEAYRISNEMYFLSLHYAHCGTSNQETELVTTNLLNVREAISAYQREGGFTAAVNAHLDRAFNASNDLTTHFNWNL